MRTLTHSELGRVAGGYDLTDDPTNPFGQGDLVPGQGGFSQCASGPASSSSSGGSGNGSGNNGLSPGTAQNLIGVVTIAGAVTDPVTGLEAGDTSDAAHKTQQYNQSQSKQICEQVDGGTWDPNANNGGGDCKLH